MGVPTEEQNGFEAEFCLRGIYSYYLNSPPSLLPIFVQALNKLVLRLAPWRPNQQQAWFVGEYETQSLRLQMTKLRKKKVTNVSY